MFDLFKIGFITVSFFDILDIAIVSFIFYRLYNLIKGTIASQIVLGLLFIILIYLLAQIADLRAVGFLLRFVADSWVVAFIILFQPELRRILTLLGRNPIFSSFFKPNYDIQSFEILSDAVFELAKHQHGALIVLTNTSDLKNIIENGEQINSKLTKKMLLSIFFPRSPLHDGAVIVKNDVIEAARCTLPLSNQTVYEGVSLGMRHRAGLGISEQSDSISLIVSEESGVISVAENSILKRGISKENLKIYLQERFSQNNSKGMKNFVELFWKKV